MRNSILKMTQKLSAEGIFPQQTVSEREIALFQEANHIVLPEDIIDYFLHLNGTNDSCDTNLFEFYSLDNFKNIDQELKNWSGIPDYGNIVHTLPNYSSYFVFASYSFQTFVYAVRLYDTSSLSNDIVVISGSDYKFIADSFQEFIERYLIDSPDIYM